MKLSIIITTILSLFLGLTNAHFGGLMGGLGGLGARVPIMVPRFTSAFPRFNPLSPPPTLVSLGRNLVPPSAGIPSSRVAPPWAPVGRTDNTVYL